MALEQGQFLTPRLIRRAWGGVERKEVPAPAEGKTWEFVFPAGYVWRLISLRITFKAAAEAGERFLGARIVAPDGKTYYEVPAPTAVAESKEANLTVATTGAEASAGEPSIKTVAMPEFLYAPEWKLEGVAQGIKAKDKFAAGVALLEAFEIEPRPELQLRDDARRSIRDLIEVLHDTLA